MYGLGSPNKSSADAGTSRQSTPRPKSTASASASKSRRSQAARRDISPSSTSENSSVSSDAEDYSDSSGRSRSDDEGSNTGSSYDDEEYEVYDDDDDAEDEEGDSGDESNSQSESGSSCSRSSASRSESSGSDSDSVDDSALRARARKKAKRLRALRASSRSDTSQQSSMMSRESSMVSPDSSMISPASSMKDNDDPEGGSNLQTPTTGRVANNKADDRPIVSPSSSNPEHPRGSPKDGGADHGRNGDPGDEEDDDEQLELARSKSTEPGSPCKVNQQYKSASQYTDPQQQQQLHSSAASPPRLPAIREIVLSQDDLNQHVFSGDEADDEMTMFNGAGEDATTGRPSVTTVSMNVMDVPDAASVPSPTKSQTTTKGLDSPSVGPNPTSSTLHSGSTQHHGVSNRIKNKERNPPVEVAAYELVSMSPEPASPAATTTQASSVVDSATGIVAGSNVEEDPVREIGMALQKAKGEYSTGSQANRRYNRPLQPLQAQDDAAAVTHTPSFMNRHEIFHKTASAAVAALLAPRDTSVSGGLRPSPILSHKDRADVMLAVSSSTEIRNAGSHVNSSTSSSTSAFHPPADGYEIDSSMQSFGRKDVSDTLIDPKTEQKLESMEGRMIDPTKTLADLLTAIVTPQDKTQMDLAYMVRRKNACGAIKVMTADAKKRVKICWTVGVLHALTSVLTDSLDKEGVLAQPDRRIQHEYEAARDRAISTLLNLSMPKENRIVLFHTPGFVQVALFLIAHDTGVARRGCTAILAYLAKSPENRLLMSRIPGFMEALVPILLPMPPRMDTGASQPPSPKKESPWLAPVENKSSDGSNSEGLSKESTKASEDSQTTLKVSPSQTPVELLGYDETADAMLRATRQNVFALLGHLSKEKDNAYHFARDSSLVRAMIYIATRHESCTCVLAVKFLATLTRHRLNTRIMVFQERDTVPALVQAAGVECDETRLYACYALQNMAQDKSCRQELAGVEGLVKTLCRRGRFAQAPDERLSAVSAIKNLCDEPANLIPLTNTPECIATLMHLAHGREDGVTEVMQYRACDALATLSHWLRKIATSGKALDSLHRGEAPDKELFVPSLRVVTWNQWQ
jgi:hypothetical protein